MNPELIRCWKPLDPLHLSYHDQEWGVPLHDDQKLFEFLVLGGFQAGLTWDIILKRRDSFRKAFDGFKPELVAKYTEKDINRLLTNHLIIRNPTKISAAINNARLFLRIRDEYGSFDFYIWKFVNGKPINNPFPSYYDAPAESAQSKAMSNDLKKRGFQFVGPKICYAFMQATGLINDHAPSCFRYEQIRKLSKV